MKKFFNNEVQAKTRLNNMKNIKKKEFYRKILIFYKISNCYLKEQALWMVI